MITYAEPVCLSFVESGGPLYDKFLSIYRITKSTFTYVTKTCFFFRKVQISMDMPHLSVLVKTDLALRWAKDEDRLRTKAQPF